MLDLRILFLGIYYKGRNKNSCQKFTELGAIKIFFLKKYQNSWRKCLQYEFFLKDITYYILLWFQFCKTKMIYVYQKKTKIHKEMLTIILWITIVFLFSVTAKDIIHYSKKLFWGMLKTRKNKNDWKWTKSTFFYKLLVKTWKGCIIAWRIKTEESFVLNT